MLYRRRILRALPPSMGATLSKVGAARGFIFTKAVLQEGASTTAGKKTITLEELRKHSDKGHAHKEEAERLQREAAVRTMETYLEKQLDTCVEECRKWAQVDGHYSYSHAFFSKCCDSTRDMQLNEKMVEVLYRELPMRLPGVQFKINTRSTNWSAKHPAWWDINSVLVEFGWGRESFWQKLFWWCGLLQSATAK